MTKPVVRRYAESDGPGVLALDASFTVDAVLRVQQDGHSFLVRAERLDRPTVKVFDIRSEIEEAAWDTAWASTSAGLTCPCTGGRPNVARSACS